MKTAKKIEIKLPTGTLVAEAMPDPEYPGISVYLERPDGIQVDLVLVEHKDSIRKLPVDDRAKLVHFYECECEGPDSPEGEQFCMAGLEQPTVEEANEFLAFEMVTRCLKVTAVKEISKEKASAEYGIKPSYSMPVFERTPYGEITAYVYSDIHDEDYKFKYQWPTKDILEQKFE